MSQAIFDTIVPSTTSGNQLAQILNDFKDAVVSGFSGTTRPSQLDAGGYWIDITDDGVGLWYFKIYDGVQDITVFTLNKNTGLASIAAADTLFQVAKISADSVGPILSLLKKRVAGNGQTLDGDVLGEVQFNGTRDDGVKVLQARIKSVSSDNVTSLAAGAYMAFEITTDNGASISEVMRLKDGKLGIGTTTPDEVLHIIGNIKAQRQADDATGVNTILRKKRVSGSGQVLSGDVIAQIDFVSCDNAGTDVAAGTIVISANQNHTNSAHGTKIVVKNKKLGQTSYTDQITIEDDVTVNTNLFVTGNFQVNGTTTYANTTNMDIKDANITLNKGGNQAAANSNKSGFKVEMSDATHAQIGYDSTKASKFVAGDVGSEQEVITAGHTQTLTNKTMTAPVLNNASIVTPTRLDAKQGTEAALTTYALTATNGQWCFATDTKVMYQVIDGSLVPAGSGGGGISLRWRDGDAAPIREDVFGTEMARFDNGSSQELYAILTVPQSYRVGKQIKLKAGQFYCQATSGNVLFKAVAALINNSNILGTYTNTRNSTNTQVAVAGVANTINSIGDIDLTDTSGQINGVAVQPGNKIRIRLFRDNASETSGASQDARLIIDSFEPTFS